MKILMPVDGSDFSKSAVSFVAARAAHLESPPEVELVNVQYPVPQRAARALGKETVQAYYETEAAKVLKSAAAMLKRAGARTSAHHLVGTIANELARIVAGDGTDLIVMGSHGDTGLKKLLLGSVASTVAASCTRPLLILRGAPVPRRESLRVSIALDGSPHGIAVARFVAAHRDFFGPAPKVTLVHVAPDLTKVSVPGLLDRQIDTGIKAEQVEAMHRAAFESVFAPAREALAHAGLSPEEARLVGGHPGHEIAAWSLKAKPDLLAMGSLGFGESRLSSMGSVAAQVASRCRIALLLVRE